MMRVLSPTYTLRVTVQDPLVAGDPQHGIAVHKFFNGQTGKTGCDEVLAAVRKALEAAGLPRVDVAIERFEHT